MNIRLNRDTNNMREKQDESANELTSQETELKQEVREY